MARSAGLYIGELSARTGTKIETIRFYERIGLLPRPLRSPSRYRIYEIGDVRRLYFLKRARELGFTLDQVRTLFALSAGDGREACGEARRLAAGHLAEVRARIADLRAIERALSDVVHRCEGGELPGCPLIDTLSAAFPAAVRSSRRSTSGTAPATGRCR